MKLKVTKKTIFFLCYSVVVLLPAYFSNSFFDLLDNVFFILGCIFLLHRRFKMDKFMAMFTIYMVFTILVTYLNGNATANIHLIISYTKIIIYLCIVRFFYKERRDTTINILYFIFLMIVMIDFVVILMYPEGLYTEVFSYNEWSKGESIYWILGNKNNHTIYYLICLYLSVCRTKNLKQRIVSNTVPTVLGIISVVTMVILKSSTSTFICTIVLLAVVLFLNRKKEVPIGINMYFIWMIYAVLFILIVLGSASFLGPIVKSLFNKDLTFTGRTTAWGNVFLMILRHPWIGNGVLNAESATKALGARALTNAHNTILQVIWQVGIIGFILYFILYVFISNEINRVKNNNLKIFNVLLMSALLIEMIFEVESGIIFFVFLLLIYLETSYNNYNSDLEKSLYNE